MFVMETEPEMGVEWWVHCGNLVAINNLEVTLTLTNESDLLPLLLSLPLTYKHIYRDIRVILASSLMHPDRLFDEWVGWWMGVEDVVLAAWLRVVLLV